MRIEIKLFVYSLVGYKRRKYTPRITKYFLWLLMLRFYHIIFFNLWETLKSEISIEIFRKFVLFLVKVTEWDNYCYIRIYTIKINFTNRFPYPITPRTLYPILRTSEKSKLWRDMIWGDIIIINIRVFGKSCPILAHLSIILSDKYLKNQNYRINHDGKSLNFIEINFLNPHWP